MPSTGTAMFYFYINELKYTPEFLGSLKLIYALGALVGLLIYNKFCKELNFKKLFSITTLVSIVLGFT